MADYKSTYAQAEYYDIIFDRDVSADIQFTIEMYRLANPGKMPTSLIDIACGPGYHALAAAKLGLQALGLDIRTEMIELAQRKAEAQCLTVSWLSQDMRVFKLDHPVDIAINTYDSFDALLTDEDAIAHLRAMRENLTPGGIYVIDMSHPTDTNYGIYGDFSYTGERDGIYVKLEWEVHEQFDLITGISHATTHLYVKHPDGTLEHFKSEGHERLYLPRELDGVIREVGGFTRIGYYGDYRKNQPLDYSGTSKRAIAVYRRN